MTPADQPLASSESKAGALHLARIAAIVVVGWSLALQFSVGTIIPPVFAVGVLFAIAIPLLRPGRKWAPFVVGLVGLAVVGTNIPGLYEEITHPSSAPAFILTLIAITAVLVLVFACAAAILSWPANTRAIGIGWVGLILVGSVLSLVAAAQVGSPNMEAGDMEVVAKANQFIPDRMEAQTGQVSLWIDNRDGARHTFTIPELGIDVEIAGLKTQRIEFEVGAGEYLVYCTVFGHEAMTMTLNVR